MLTFILIVCLILNSYFAYENLKANNCEFFIISLIGIIFSLLGLIP